MKKNKKLLIGIFAFVVIVIGGILLYKGINKYRLENFYNDLNLLEEKVDYYYEEYGGVPVKEEYTGVENFKAQKNENDSDTYYIIDINSLENLKLKNKITGEGDDVYIINDISHTIYYAKGLMIEGKTYYTLPVTK